MAQNKLDDREVNKIKETLARDGPGRAAVRFDENSPEFRRAMQDRQRKRKYAGSQQRRLIAETNTKETRTMEQQNEKKQQTPAQQRQSNEQQQSPAQQRSGQAQRTAAQQRVVARQKMQAQRNARVKAQAQSQSQGQAM